jgi:hypothetical protein
MRASQRDLKSGEIRGNCRENVKGNGVAHMMQNNSSETSVKVVLVQEAPGEYLEHTGITEQNSIAAIAVVETKTVTIHRASF